MSGAGENAGGKPRGNGEKTGTAEKRAGNRNGAVTYAEHKNGVKINETERPVDFTRGFVYNEKCKILFRMLIRKEWGYAGTVQSVFRP